MYYDKLPANIRNVWRAAYANNYLSSGEVASLLLNMFAFYMEGIKPSKRKEKLDFNSSFLRNCKTVSDLNDKIDIFKQFVSSEWGELWKEFFASLRMKCNPFEQISSSDYLIYKFNPENKELISVLLSDEIIKKEYHKGRRIYASRTKEQ